MKERKPILHARDHMCGGADPIPGICDVITAPGGAPDEILAHPCLIHYWPCDEPSGSLIDRKGSVDLAPSTYGSYPQYGAGGPFPATPELTAVANDGTAGIVGASGRFASSISGESWDEFTIELWLYLTNYATTGSATALQLAGTGTSIYVFPTTGSDGDPAELYFTHVTVSIHEATGTAFPLNAWQHVVARWDGTQHTLWRNGALVATDTGPVLFSPNGNIALLNRTESGWQPWRGRAAQVAIYNCALTDAEIGEHYASGGSAAGLVLQTDGEGGTNWAQIGEASIADDAITADKVADDAITSAHIAADAVGSSEIAAGAVGSSELASTAVTPGTYGDATHVGAFTVDADGRITAASNVAVTGGGGASLTDTLAWMPLADADGILVLDANGKLIPTLIPIA